MKIINYAKWLIVIFLTYIICNVCNAQPPPMAISELTVAKLGENLRLAWPPVTGDAYGFIETITHYNIYRGTTPDFIPDTTSGTNRIAQPTSNSFDDIDALLAVDSYYYYVFAVTADGTESLLPSNIGCKIRLDLTYDPAGTNKYWLSLPYNSSYTTASDLGGDAPNINQVIRWDPATQTEEVWDQGTSTGTDFAIIPGKAYAIVISDNTTLNLVGSYSPTTIDMTYNADNFNVNWLSIPHPNAYGNASNLSSDIDNSTKVGKYDNQNDTYKSWFLLNGAWMGDDFSLNPGEGVLGVIIDDSTWNLSLGCPTVTATADKFDCLNTDTIFFSGTAEDKNGLIVTYQWDYEGDGIFEYSDGSSPDTSFIYNTAGTYHPTVLVTDNDGFKGYHYRTVVVYGLDNEISVEKFNPSGEETVEFTYTISDDGLMTIKVYDKDNNLIRTLFTDQAVTAGQNQESWDGKNDLGETVADGTYYVVFEYTVNGKTYTQDLRISTGGQDITGEITDVTVSGTLSPLEGQYVNIIYTLPQKTLITVEIKDQGGTIIRHLLTDTPRTAGNHTEIWDGADDNGNIVQPGTAFYVTITATSLADNAMITGGFAPSMSDISSVPLRFSPASNPYGIRDLEGDRVVITFTLNKQANVTATVYNATGSVVRTMTEPDLPAGQSQLSWNGRNDGGILMADGNYTIQLRAQDNSGTYSNVFIVQVEIFY